MPYLGSGAEDQLLRNICMLARTHKSAVTLLRVLDVPRAISLDSPDIPGLPEAKESLESAIEIARQSGIKATYKIVPARETGPAIVEQAAALDADLIIMEAMRERERLYSDAPLARTVDLVLKRAQCAVWVSRIWELEK